MEIKVISKKKQQDTDKQKEQSEMFRMTYKGIFGEVSREDYSPENDLGMLLEELKELIACKLTYGAVRDALNEKYERISNQPEKNYDAIYDVMEILKSKRVAMLEKNFFHKESIVVEILEFGKAPHGKIIILNGFKGNRPCGIEIYLY